MQNTKASVCPLAVLSVVSKDTTEEEIPYCSSLSRTALSVIHTLMSRLGTKQ